jgi:glycosyltransferase involved in cell wall biosynthesis
MKILHMDAGREMRGGQWQALRLIEGLSAQGVESTLLARKGSPLFAAAARGGFRVEPWGVARAARLVRAHELIHAHDAKSHTLGAFLKGRPLVVSRRVAFAVRSKWKYARADRYIAVSEFVKSALIDGGVDVDKIVVAYDGVPALEQSNGEGVLALANAADAMKGAPLAIAAAENAGVALTLTSALERDLKGAAVFLYISHSEGLGSAVLLAMSAGVAVIASRTGGLPEAIHDGVDGVLVENRVEEIARALKGLVEDRERRRALGAAARQTVMERFSVERMVRNTLHVYQQVLN